MFGLGVDMKPTFAKETDLCAAFIEALKKPWVAYPESAGWDILVVNSEDQRQIGIQAKLKLNAKVMSQAIEGPGWWGAAGPDFRAVLVPDIQTNEITALAPFCGITIIRMTSKSSWGNPRFYPYMPNDNPMGPMENEWHERLPTRRHEVPEFVPDCQAGASAPIQLTRWKIAALKLDVLLVNTGYLTRDDFKNFGIDIRRWIGHEGWLQAGPDGFIKGPRYPDFRFQHPRVWEEIVADTAKWQRTQSKLVA